jgi:tRNA(Ile2) C34 agmatinyltransferase TiaS
MLRCTSSKFQLPFKLAALDVLGDLRHAALDVGQVLRADDALRLTASRHAPSCPVCRHATGAGQKTRWRCSACTNSLMGSENRADQAWDLRSGELDEVIRAF